MTEEESLSPHPRFVVSAISLVDNPLYKKCPRCWQFHSVVGNFDDLCDRCCRVIIEAFKDHWSYPHILATIEEQKKLYKYVDKQ